MTESRRQRIIPACRPREPGGQGKSISQLSMDSHPTPTRGEHFAGVTGYLGQYVRRNIYAARNVPCLSDHGFYGILDGEMKPIEYFVPGIRDEREAILARLRRPIPPHVTTAYTTAYSEPGETVLVPYCQGPSTVREITEGGRRALALNFDPSVVGVLRTALLPLPERKLVAVVARLGDSMKQGVPLSQYLKNLYASFCPACLRPAVADYFVWDREQDAPVAKYIRCPSCGWDGRTAVESEDRDRLAQVPVRGMHYHYVLDRVAPQTLSESFRARAESLLRLYSPRNLYALAELTIRIEGLFQDQAQHQALTALLLDCLDRCSSLTPLPSSIARRRGLSRPNRYLERNVWFAFRESITRLQSSSGRPIPEPAPSIGAFCASQEGTAVYVGQGLVRDLPEILAPHSIRLILFSPPALDAAAWTLSYLWGAWLHGNDSVTALRPLVRQRTHDATWYARVMASSLRRLAGLLRKDGRLVLVLSGESTVVLEALTLAALRARLDVATLLQCGADYRLELTPSLPPVPPASPVSLEEQIVEVVLKAAMGLIQARGEPVPWRTLHAEVQRQLAATGLPARALGAQTEELSPLDLVGDKVRASLENPELMRLAGPEGQEELWWLADPAEVDTPLCDRVERATHQILENSLGTTEEEFAAKVYRQFPGSLTPDAGLIAACLRSSGRQSTAGYWQLRPEDLPAERKAERHRVIQDLLALGKRLGYRTVPGREPFDVAWFGGETVRALFLVRWQAALGKTLALSGWTQNARPYLVIPGGRAALVSYKLAHNPLWQQAVDEAGWRFIKYRHVRRLVAQPELDEYVLQTIVGLDPIVEQEAAQLSLF